MPVLNYRLRQGPLDEGHQVWRRHAKSCDMRKTIVAMQTQLDGYIEGPNGKLDWATAEDKEPAGNSHIEEAARREHLRRWRRHTGSNLMNAGLFDEVQLMMNPLMLGGGKALFMDVKSRHALKQVGAKPLKSAKVSLVYGARG